MHWTGHKSPYSLVEINDQLSIKWSTSLHCYLATRHEGFRDHGFVLPKVESLRVQSFVASQKSGSVAASEGTATE